MAGIQAKDRADGGKTYVVRWRPAGGTKPLLKLTVVTPGVSGFQLRRWQPRG
jgi:hypothetical protein